MNYRILTLLISMHFAKFTFSQNDTTTIILSRFVSNVAFEKVKYFQLNDTTYGSLFKKNFTWESMQTATMAIQQSNLDAFFDNKGRLVFICDYDYENLNGAFVSYHKNGMVKCIGRYSFGHKIGEWKYFTQKGKLRKQCIFK